MSTSDDVIQDLTDQLNEVKRELKNEINKNTQLDIQNKKLLQQQQKMLANKDATNKDQLQLELTKLKTENERLINKITSLETQITQLKNENQLLKSNQNISSSSSSSQQQQHYETIINTLRKERDDALNKMEEQIKTYKESIRNHEIENAVLAEKLSNFKNTFLDMNLQVRVFNVIKIDSWVNKPTEITFGQSEDDTFVMKVKNSVKEFFINIEDIESVQPIEKNKIEVHYIHEGKAKIMKLIINELIMEQFIQTYHDYSQKSIQVANNVK